ncbi:MAG: hypothetical protein LUC96_06580, partial [Alistipes sp.]|uniref:hypothetical protein n=1 Tax=Alistipes sp. TaxID=1872444 RepID=UPI0025C49607
KGGHEYKNTRIYAMPFPLRRSNRTIISQQQSPRFRPKSAPILQTKNLRREKNCQCKYPVKIN